MSFVTTEIKDRLDFALACDANENVGDALPGYLDALQLISVQLNQGCRTSLHASATASQLRGAETAALKLFQVAQQSLARAEILFRKEADTLCKRLVSGAKPLGAASPISASRSQAADDDDDDDVTDVSAALEEQQEKRRVEREQQERLLMQPFLEANRLNELARERGKMRAARLEAMPAFTPLEQRRKEQEVAEGNLSLMREITVNFAVAREKQQRIIADIKREEQRKLALRREAEARQLRRNRVRPPRNEQETLELEKSDDKMAAEQADSNGSGGGERGEEEHERNSGGGDDDDDDEMTAAMKRVRENNSMTRKVLKLFGIESTLLKRHLIDRIAKSDGRNAKRYIIEYALPQLMDPEHRFGKLIARVQGKCVELAQTCMDRIFTAQRGVGPAASASAGGGDDDSGEHDEANALFDDTVEQLAFNVQSVHNVISTQLMPALEGSYESTHTMSEVDSFIYCAVERAIFSRIFEQVFELFQWRHRFRDARLAATCVDLMTASPGHLGIPNKFWLLSADGATDEEPYARAIAKLQLLPSCRSVDEKLACLCATLKEICASIERFYKRGQAIDERKPGADVVAADDLLPIYSWCLIKANLPGAFSECAFVNGELLHRSCMLGEEGFAVATFATCLQYCSSLDRSMLETNLQYVDLPEEQTEEEEVVVAVPPASDNANNALSRFKAAPAVNEDDLDDLFNDDDAPTFL
jgi:Vacuolar sorting protein 9 (VPS9) domain